MIRRISLCILLLLQPLLVFLPRIQVHAASPNVLIYQLQTGTTNAATQEYLSLYNNGPDAVDVTGWCVVYGSSSDATQTTLGCLTAPSQTKLMLPTKGIATFATNDFITTHAGFHPDITFSAGVASSSGHVRLFDVAKQEVDKLGWGGAAHPEATAVAAHANGSILQRLKDGEGLKDTNNNANDFEQTILVNLPATMLYEEQVIVDACSNITGVQSSIPSGYLLDEAGNCQADACLNIDGLQIDVPDSYIGNEGDCQLIPLESATLIITELLPNPSSYDAGREFIELHNPHDRQIGLKGYVVQLAPSFNKSHSLPDQIIQPGSYLTLSDTHTGLVLPNTSAQLRLVAPNGEVVSMTDVYASPAENMAWALIGQTWQYTNQPTPGLANLGSLEDDASEVVEPSSLGPCPTGQYRSAETNRCRLLQTAVSALVTCGPNQERNMVTNRCRSVLAASTNLTPCKAGQERNPETNRCRAIGSASDLQPCEAGEERNPDTNRCRKTVSASNTGGIAKVKDVASQTLGGGVKWWLAITAVILAIGYGLYEWRHDITNYIRRRSVKSTR